MEIDADDGVSNNQKSKKPLWAVDPKWVTTPYLLLMLLIIWIVFIICFPMALSFWFLSRFGGITEGTTIMNQL